MSVIPLVRPVAVVLSASVLRWSMNEPDTEQVIVATVKHAIRHCEGVVSLFLGGNQIEERRCVNIVSMLSHTFLSFGYRSFSIIEAVTEDALPPAYTQLQQECVRMYTVREHTGARFDIIASASQMSKIEDALYFAVRHIRGDRRARIPSGVFRCVFLKGVHGETGTYSF